MNKFVRVTVTVIAGWLLAVASYADDSVYHIEQLPKLTQEPQHATVSQRVTSRFIRSHYRNFVLDDKFSAKIFERYLTMLDYSHSLFLASDVVAFSAKKHQLDEELKSGQLNMAFELFNLAQKRRFERYQYALSLLNNPMTFNGNDTINIDRSKAPWPGSIKELDKLWDAKVKSDQLNLKLAGKTDKQIRKMLAKVKVKMFFS